MAVVPLTYLFDVEGFRELIAPIAKQLENGDITLLRVTATEAAHHNPHIWPMLEDHRLYASDLGNEEEEFADEERRSSFWMLILLATFWQPIPAPKLRGPSIIELLQEWGWTEREIHHLLRGNSQRALLQPQIVSDPLERPENYEEWPFWCWFGRMPAFTGWLAFSDVQEILVQLEKMQGIISRIASPKTRAEYVSIVHMLTAAKHAERGLFLALAD